MRLLLQVLFPLRMNFLHLKRTDLDLRKDFKRPKLPQEFQGQMKVTPCRYTCHLQSNIPVKYEFLTSYSPR